MNLSIATSPGNKSRMFKVLCPIERKDGKTYWMRVGSAFTNKDLSVNIHLDVLPVNMKLQVREFDEDDLQARGKRRDDDAGGAPRASDNPPF